MALNAVDLLQEQRYIFITYTYVELICWENTKMLLAGDVYPDIGGTSSMDTFLVLRIGHIPLWVNAERNIIVQNYIANI